MTALRLREHIPLQQGLRLFQRLSYNTSGALREHIPLQQGLRPCVSTYTLSTKEDSESIFHYNKDWDTADLWPEPPEISSPRAYSITTRIETLLPAPFECELQLREHIPLQQGLRLRGCLWSSLDTLSPRAYSITTRIETRLELLLFCTLDVHSESIFHYNKDWDPSFPLSMSSCRLREHIPLQQGLRLWSAPSNALSKSPRAYSITTRIETARSAPSSAGSYAPRAYSITTRIETPFQCGLVCPERLSESIFHYNKDWDVLTLSLRKKEKSSESIFHYNKDWDWFAEGVRVIFKTPRAYSITTRIETSFFGLSFFTLDLLREHIPLQQGLRPFFWARYDSPKGSESIFHYNKDWDWYALRSYLKPQPPRAYSITTRIETRGSPP